MANYDGPTYNIVAGVAKTLGYETNTHWVVYWTTQPEFVSSGFGSGGSGPGSPTAQDVNGYGYAQSG